MNFTPSVLARFMSKVEKSDECWLWLGAKYGSGYGNFYINGRTTGAHRASYEGFVGPIPTGLEIDHLCRVRACVNPQHLEPVTHRENMHRTPLSVFAIQSDKRQCSEGHDLVPGNIYTRPRRPNTRECIICKRARNRRHKARRRSAVG